jgi:hypothetical protein
VFSQHENKLAVRFFGKQDLMPALARKNLKIAA